MAFGWPSFAIFMALLSLSMINIAESRFKIPLIFPSKMSVSTFDPHAADTPSSTTPSLEVSGGVRVHPVPKAGALNMLSSTNPSQEISEGVRVHPVPKAAIGVDAPSTFPTEYQDHMYESLVRVHPVPKAGALFEPVPPIMPENNAHVHPVPRAASTGVDRSPPPMIPDNYGLVHPEADGGVDMSSPVQTKGWEYLTSGLIMADRVMAMAPTKI